VTRVHPPPPRVRTVAPRAAADGGVLIVPPRPGGRCQHHCRAWIAERCTRPAIRCRVRLSLLPLQRACTLNAAVSALWGRARRAQAPEDVRAGAARLQRCGGARKMRAHASPRPAPRPAPPRPPPRRSAGPASTPPWRMRSTRPSPPTACSSRASGWPWRHRAARTRPCWLT
jgi:hypothetical protein